MATLALALQGAMAGDGRPGYRVGGQRTHAVSHRIHRHAARLRTHRRGSAVLMPPGPSAGLPHPAASSGVMLGAGRPRIRHVAARHAGRHDLRPSHRRQGRHRAGTALVIVVGEGGTDQAPRLSGSEPLLEGPCKPNAYCTMRLGPYANSPKIITLNQTGRAIAE
jgi:hypothetical protein